MPKPTKVPTNKTLAATGGSAVGGAIAIITVYVIEQHWGKLPQTVVGAITALISAIVTLIAGWLMPHGANEVIMKDASGKMVSGR